MDWLLTAIKSKFTGSQLATDVGNRLYLDRAPGKPVFPYVVFFLVSSPIDRTFTEEFRTTTVQFSLFSSSQPATEITSMYNHLSALFEKTILTLTGNTNIESKEVGFDTMMEDIDTTEGIQGVRHWAVDFEFWTSRN